MCASLHRRDQDPISFYKRISFLKHGFLVPLDSFIAFFSLKIITFATEELVQPGFRRPFTVKSVVWSFSFVGNYEK